MGYILRRIVTEHSALYWFLVSFGPVFDEEHDGDDKPRMNKGAFVPNGPLELGLPRKVLCTGIVVGFLPTGPLQQAPLSMDCAKAYAVLQLVYNHVSWEEAKFGSWSEKEGAFVGGECAHVPSVLGESRAFL